MLTLNPRDISVTIIELDVDCAAPDGSLLVGFGRHGRINTTILQTASWQVLGIEPTQNMLTLTRRVPLGAQSHFIHAILDSQESH